jgi:hypothetical protein
VGVIFGLFATAGVAGGALTEKWYCASRSTG